MQMIAEQSHREDKKARLASILADDQDAEVQRCENGSITRESERPATTAEKMLKPISTMQTHTLQSIHQKP